VVGPTFGCETNSPPEAVVAGRAFRRHRFCRMQTRLSTASAAIVDAVMTPGRGAAEVLNNRQAPRPVLQPISSQACNAADSDALSGLQPIPRSALRGP